MNMKGLIVVLFLLFCSGSAIGGTIQQCGSDADPSGTRFGVKGNDINVRVGPGVEYEKVINKKASSILKRTYYVSIDESVTVIEECTKSGWSKIRVIDPDHLSDSHRGWVLSKYLKKPQNIKKYGNWYSDWSSEFNLDITRTLISNNVRGCGEYKYRENLSNKNDFLVNCTSDGERWVLYRVSTSKNSAKKAK